MIETKLSPIVPATDVSPKHPQGHYTLPDGTTRVLYAQRVLGHVRLTDEPEVPGATTRAYLIERCIEADPLQDGTSAAAHLAGLVADYLDQAKRLRRCPLERDAMLTETAAAHMVAPRAQKASPFETMLKYKAATWAEAIELRAAARRATKDKEERQQTLLAAALCLYQWATLDPGAYAMTVLTLASRVVACLAAISAEVDRTEGAATPPRQPLGALTLAALGNGQVMA